MIKLLIVEDEEPDIEILQNRINWKEVFIEPVGFAQDGETALDLISLHNPDIVLSDIMVPLKNGIELADAIRLNYPDTKIIFISGFQEFEYAKAAIAHHVVEYITKPINIDEVQSILGTVARECLTEKAKRFEEQNFRQQFKLNLPILRERFFRDWAFGMSADSAVITQKAGFLEINLDSSQMLVLAIQLDDYVTSQSNIDEYKKELLDKFVLNSIDEITSDIPASHAFLTKQGEYLVLIPLKTKAYDEAYISSVSERIKSNINANCNQTCTIGIGGITEDFSSLPVYYKKAVDAIEYKFYYGKNHVIHYKDLFKNENLLCIDKEYYLVEIIKAVKVGNVAYVSRLLDELFDKLSGGCQCSSLYIRNICIEILSAYTNSLIETYGDEAGDIFKDNMSLYLKIMEFEVIGDLKDYLGRILENTCSNITGNVKRKNDLIIDRIKKIINDKYNKITSVEEIAREIFFSPGYISTVFKNGTGDTIIHYLTCIRMKKAKELLSQTNMKIYEIAKYVGYNNVTHFSSMFKNHTGSSPVEYRENLPVHWI